ncbi:WXG100 family type VII secretion target [Kitasatospora sp. NPDC057936]|uniref:WXG100 family type VII secretion target n=1 Tax=Kitasatospora sp. NPDC057936 TaxID=3346283 RepID=UPI0036D9D09E
MADGTNFEQYDHAQLKDMVRSTDAKTVVDRGVQLQAAGQVLKDLSAALKSHVDNVGWEGPAAESFKTWAGNLQKSATLLGDYSTKAGDALLQAGESLSTAQVAVPDPPNKQISLLAAAKNQLQYLSPGVGSQIAESGQSFDDFMAKNKEGWITKAQADVAAARIESDRQEAIRQMEKLAQAYSAATTTLNSLEEPTLPGTPGAKHREDLVGYSPGGEGSTHPDGAVHHPSGSAGGQRSAYAPPGGGYSGGSEALRQPPVGQQKPEALGRIDPISSSRGEGVPPPQEQEGAVAPSIPVDRPGLGLDSLPAVPSLLSPSVPVGPIDGGNLPLDGVGGAPGRSGGAAEAGGNPAFPIGGSVPAGGHPGKGGSVPGRSGGSTSGRPAPFGGGSLPGRSATPGLPTGTVFGACEAQPGRAGVSGMPGMGGMHPGPVGPGMGASGGGTRGRGLTSTGGGIVGGRKSPSAGGEFTPGGTGLRRQTATVEGGARSGQNGMMPGVHGGGAGRNERDRRQRPDYLHEDEETWTSGTPLSNPNVVE